MVRVSILSVSVRYRRRGVRRTIGGSRVWRPRIWTRRTFGSLSARGVSAPRAPAELRVRGAPRGALEAPGRRRRGVRPQAVARTAWVEAPRAAWVEAAPWEVRPPAQTARMLRPTMLAVVAVRQGARGCRPGQCSGCCFSVGVGVGRGTLELVLADHDLAAFATGAAGRELRDEPRRPPQIFDPGG